MLLEQDSLRQEPLLCWAKTLRALGEPASAATRLREALSTGVFADGPLWDLWFEISAVDLRMDAETLLGSLPVAPGHTGPGADIRWALDSLRGRATTLESAPTLTTRPDDGTLLGAILAGRSATL